MANIVNPAYDYTYDGLLSTKIFLEPAIKNPDIGSLFTIVGGINFKQQFNIGQQLGKVMKGEQGCGTPVVTGGPVNIVNQTLEVCAFEAYLEQCHDTFQGTILGEDLQANTLEPDLVGTRMGSYLQNLVSSAISRDIFRQFSFGDTSSGDPYYNKCDGLWTKLIAGGSSYEVTVVDDNIASLVAADIKQEFQDLWAGADILLKQIPSAQKAFYVTGNVWEAIMTYYEDIAAAGGFVLREENGVITIRYRGIKIIPLYAWDEWISADNLGDNVRMLYTTKANHLIGVQEARTMGDTRFWFDPNTNLNKIRARFKLGYNYLHNKLQAISYGNV